MSSNNQLATAQVQRDRQNDVVARHTNTTESTGHQFYQAKVTVASGNGTYSVTLIGTDGQPLNNPKVDIEDTEEVAVPMTFDGVVAETGGSTHTVGEYVTLKFTNPQSPVIFAAGGGSTCSVSIDVFGVLFG